MLQVLQACLTYAVAYLRSGRTHDGALLCRLLAALGPTFVKLGQLLSVRPDLLGEQLSQQLSSPAGGHNMGCAYGAEPA
jgi:ubiquinone biosynthesis protein